MERNIHAKFEGKVTCALRNDKFSKFSPGHVLKSKNWDFDGVLLSKVENV